MEEGRSEAEEEGLWRRRVKEGRMDCGGGRGGGGKDVRALLRVGITLYNVCMTSVRRSWAKTSS
jgi:hypothetical protein